MIRRWSRAALVGAAAVLSLCAASCRRPAEDARPNVLWIVWDTVRADRLGAYGYERPTTPHLDAWIAEARVFEDCVSPSPWTVPSHASMFTGLLPSEHGAGFEQPWLDDEHVTIAELLRDAGYQTFLWSANPHVSAAANFQQGFEVAAHPWDPERRERALAIVRRKIQGDRSSELPSLVGRGQAGEWAIKASGELAEQDLVGWLDARDADRPFFAFINYMEAHRPLVPPRRFRERLMTPEQVTASYAIDRSWLAIWSYTFGLHEYSAEELEVMGRTYDAAIAELDELFARVLDALRARDLLENTIVVLAADHGELLGEHHMLDHQYSLHRPLLRVPLVIHHPDRVPPGREPGPATSLDLFPTLLALAGIEVPSRPYARSLLDLPAERQRLAEYPSAFPDAFPAVRRAHPDWDPTPWKRGLRALHDGPWKLIWGTDGRHEVYDLGRDPLESENLVERATAERDRLEQALAALVPALGPAEGVQRPPVSEEHRRMLEALGYAEPREEAPDGDSEP